MMLETATDASVHTLTEAPDIIDFQASGPSLREGS